MTNELEKTFFDTFGIEPKEKQVKDCEDCTYYEETLDAPCYTCTAFKCYYKEEKYPQITDRILLELICICSQYGFCPSARNIEDLKLKVLKRLLELKKSLKNNYEHQGCHNAFTRKVRTLFEEG